MVEINAPGQDGTISSGSPVTVEGTVLAIDGRSVNVRLLDNNGNVLSETSRLLDRNSAAIESDWRVILFPNLTSGASVTVLAYVTSPTEGNIVAADGVNVVVDELPADEAFLTIDTPLPFAVVPNQGEVTISGYAGRLFENTVTIRAFDSLDNLIGTTFATMDTAEMGGSGSWSATLILDVPSGTPGRIIATGTSPMDGSDTVSVTRFVTYEDPEANLAFVGISDPFDGSVIGIQQGLTAFGVAGNTTEDEVYIDIQTLDGSLIASDIVPLQETGAWRVFFDLGNTVTPEDGEVVVLYAYIESSVDGTIEAFDVVEITTIRNY